MKLEKCQCCNVMKDEQGKARCPYCSGLLCKDYPMGRKCIDCGNLFPSCKCQKDKDGCSGGGCSGGGCSGGGYCP